MKKKEYNMKSLLESLNIALFESKTVKSTVKIFSIGILMKIVMIL